MSSPGIRVLALTAALAFSMSARAADPPPQARTADPPQARPAATTTSVPLTSAPASAPLPVAVDTATTPAGPVIQALHEPVPAQVTAPPAADKPPPGPSKALLRKAREAGMKTEVQNGETRYCWEDVDTGTHFKTKKCVNELQLEEVLQERQAQRDLYRNNTQCGGGACGSH